MTLGPREREGVFPGLYRAGPDGFSELCRWRATAAALVQPHTTNGSARTGRRCGRSGFVADGHTHPPLSIRSALMIVCGADSVFDDVPPRRDAVSNLPPSTPNARDRAIVRRSSGTLANNLPVESQTSHEADRTQVVRLDIRFEAMQGIARKRQAAAARNAVARAIVGCSRRTRTRLSDIARFSSSNTECCCGLTPT